MRCILLSSIEASGVPEESVYLPEGSLIETSFILKIGLDGKGTIPDTENVLLNSPVVPEEITSL